MNDLRKLDEDSYLIIRNFLSDDEVNYYANIFSNSNVEYGKNYKEIDISVNSIIPSVKKKFDDFADDLNKQTGRNINFLSPVIDVLRTENINLPWHQEHEGYFMYQNPKNHLRVWIPLIKKSPETDGLDITSHADLLKHNSDFFNQHVVDSGARFYRVENGKTVVENRNDDSTTVVDFDLEKFTINTMAMPGDAVVFRGDCVHRTQPNSKNRLAIGFKLCDDSQIISKQKFFSGGKTKHEKFLSLPHYTPYFDLFETRDMIPFKEINDIIQKRVRK